MWLTWYMIAHVVSDTYFGKYFSFLFILGKFIKWNRPKLYDAMMAPIQKILTKFVISQITNPL